jgi:hypothetical protein
MNFEGGLLLWSHKTCLTLPLFSSPDARGHVRYCHHLASVLIAVRRLPSLLSSVTFYILIFFSETIWPIGTKLARDVHWMVPYKVCVFLLIRSTQMKQEAQRCQKWCVHNISHYACF